MPWGAAGTARFQRCLARSRGSPGTCSPPQPPGWVRRKHEALQTRLPSALHTVPTQELTHRGKKPQKYQNTRERRGRGQRQCQAATSTHLPGPGPPRPRAAPLAGCAPRPRLQPRTCPQCPSLAGPSCPPRHAPRVGPPRSPSARRGGLGSAAPAAAAARGEGLHSGGGAGSQSLAPGPALLPCPPFPGRGLPAAKPPVSAEPAPPRGLGPRHLRRPCLWFTRLLWTAPAAVPPRGQRRMSGLPR